MSESRDDLDHVSYFFDSAFSGVEVRKTMLSMIITDGKVVDITWSLKGGSEKLCKAVGYGLAVNTFRCFYSD